MSIGYLLLDLRNGVSLCPRQKTHQRNSRAQEQASISGPGKRGWGGLRGSACFELWFLDAMGKQVECSL